MPSRAIGMGMCPRCGKPGTVVIKAGNYVYIKHGNTWHYIGTIDKVNLNKILIKDNKILEEVKENNVKYNYKNIKDRKIKVTIILAIITAAIFAGILIIRSIKINNANTISSLTSLKCHAIKIDNSTNVILVCNNTKVSGVNNYSIGFNVNSFTNNYLNITNIK